MLKLISWNIDSLNAALTSASPRAQLSRDVLNTLKGENADIIAIQETKLPAAGPSHWRSIFPAIRPNGCARSRRRGRDTPEL